MSVLVKIWRNNEWFLYSVDIGTRDSLTVLDILNYIKEEIDPSLSYRSMCRSGICGTCAVKVNSKPVLACKTKLVEFGEVLTIEPLNGMRVIKDLVVDHEILINRIQGIKPKERIKGNTSFDMERSFECILCGICDSVCPVILEAPYFGGPMAFLRAYKYFEGSSEEDFRIIGDFLKSKFINLCTHCKNCSFACPKLLYPERIIHQEEEKLVHTGLLEKPKNQLGFDFLNF